MTDQLGLERLAKAALHDPQYDGQSFERVANPATILALISQAREAERMRGAATDLVSWFDKPMIGGRVWIIPAGDQGADDAVEAVRQALAPATGGGE